MSFRSTGVRRDGEDYVLDGEVTLKAITRPISLRLEPGGFGPDLTGATRAGFSAIGQLKRSDFGSISMPRWRPAASWSVTGWISISRSRRC